MMLLSEHLEEIEERPGMYIGSETATNLQTYILGFITPHSLCKAYSDGLAGINKGPTLISHLDFDEAFAAVLAMAKEVEAEHMPSDSQNGPEEARVPDDVLFPDDELWK